MRNNRQVFEASQVNFSVREIHPENFAARTQDTRTETPELSKNLNPQPGLKYVHHLLIL